MPRNAKSWVAAAITTMLVTAVPILGNVSAASAAPGDPIVMPTTPSCVIALASGDPATAPPAPTCYDPSGSDLDEIGVPQNVVDSRGHGVGYVDGNMNQFDPVSSSDGASQVLVQSMVYDPAMGFAVKGHSWNLSFNLAPVGTDAGETYRAAVVSGSCNPATSLWQVDWIVLNRPDDTMRYLPKVDGSVYRMADNTVIPPGIQDVFLQASRIFDGQEASLGVESMFPGTYKFAATKNGASSGWQSWRLEVPSCGKVLGPEAGGSTGGGSTFVSPTGRFRQVASNKMKATVISRKVDYAAQVKIVINPKVGKTRSKVFTVRAHSTFRKTFRAAPGTNFVMKARVRYALEDGRYALKWKVLKRATLRKR